MALTMLHKIVIQAIVMIYKERRTGKKVGSSMTKAVIKDGGSRTTVVYIEQKRNAKKRRRA